MKHGEIVCVCDKGFYFETVNDIVHCIGCGRVHDVSKYPVKVEETPKEGD